MSELNSQDTTIKLYHFWRTYCSLEGW